jgi:DinB superfamily
MQAGAHTPEIDLLLRLLDEAYSRKAWHGPNLRGAIRGLGPRVAAWRPSAGRHNIWEIVVHCAYWKYAVRRRILGEKRGVFPLRGSNWFARPVAASSQAWHSDVALLQDMHQGLRFVVAGLSPQELKKIPRGSRVQNLVVLSGIAAHDVYHAGQIQLLKRLARDRIEEKGDD